jgi:sulfate permease, SulP family
VPFLDSTAANTIAGLARKARRQGVKVILSGTSRGIRQELFTHGIKPPLVSYERTIEVALHKLRRDPRLQI